MEEEKGGTSWFEDAGSRKILDSASPVHHSSEAKSWKNKTALGQASLRATNSA